MKTKYDVAVVGAGPAGSGAAAALAEQGWEVLLLEQERLPRHKVCGEFLSPEAQQSLSTLGLYEAVTALSPVALHHAQILSPRGQRVRVALPGTAWGISRFALDAVLANAAQAAGVTVWTGAPVSKVTETTDGYSLQLQMRGDGAESSFPATATARTVILACGRHSRLIASSRRPQKKVRHVGIKCHYTNVELPAQVELFFFAGGYGGLNPVENGRVNLCLLVTYAAIQKAGKSPAAMLEAARHAHPALATRLAPAQTVPNTLKTVAAVDIAQSATPWQNAPCLGDAATMITPLCGDGMAMALRGAALCVPLTDAYLRGHIAQSTYREKYSSAWHAEFDRRILLGRFLQGGLAQAPLAELLIGTGRLAPPLVRYLVAATRG